MATLGEGSATGATVTGAGTSSGLSAWAIGAIAVGALLVIGVISAGLGAGGTTNTSEEDPGTNVAEQAVDQELDGEWDASGESDEVPTAEEPQPSDPVAYETGESYCEIISREDIDGRTYLTVDYVQYRDHPEGGVEITNDNPKLRVFELTDETLYVWADEYTWELFADDPSGAGTMGSPGNGDSGFVIDGGLFFELNERIESEFTYPALYYIDVLDGEVVRITSIFVS